MPQSVASSTQSKGASTSSGSPRDDWSAVTDSNERRKIQNRIAQRKYRDKVRQQRDDEDRKAVDQQRAGGSYTGASEFDGLDRGKEEGLPWGSISMRHIVETGRAKDKSSRESSGYGVGSRTGGSSR